MQATDAATDQADASAPRLRCVLVCDLADSTALIERLGDAQASLLLREHDRVARQALTRHHGQEIDKTDGFLILFRRPIDAVAFALDYRQQLRRLGEENGFALHTRVGIHVGEVLSWRNTPSDIAGGAKPVEVEGLAKAIAARLMSLADPGQILLSESAYSLALRARGELDPGWKPRWQEHGRYRLHGVANPLPVFEVSAHGAAPHPPRDKIKAKRIRPWYRWPPAYAALALALIAAPLWYALKPAPAIAFIERDWIVVGDVRNLTGETLFDRGLETAIRVGLEESRYVNVLSQPKQRQVLQLMQAEPDQPIDRVLGSELAERAGARAVMLATISQHAGAIRFTAELVDPGTQATVYARSAEVHSLDRVLDSVDSVMREVRADLGESLAQIENSSTPLPQAMTANLDALRAYSLGLQKESAGEREDARQSFALALSLDPDFASAEAGLARYWYWAGDADQSLSHYRRALARSDRLTSREHLSYRATVATLSGDPQHLDRWKAILDVYPDLHTAAHNLAQFYWTDNQFDRSLHYARIALAPQSPTGIASSYVAAMAHLGLGDLESARQMFESARAGGGLLPRRICASIRAGLHDVDSALACFNGIPDAAPLGERADALWFRAALLAEAERPTEALNALDDLDGLLDGLPLPKRSGLMFAAAALRGRLEPEALPPGAAIARLEGALTGWLAESRSEHRRGLDVFASALTALAIGHGDAAAARRALALSVENTGSPYSLGLRRVVEAWVMALEGDAKTAEEALSAIVGGNSPVLAELALLRIAETQGDPRLVESRREALRARRHAALAEFGESHLLLSEYLLTMQSPAGGPALADSQPAERPPR